MTLVKLQQNQTLKVTLGRVPYFYLSLILFCWLGFGLKGTNGGEFNFLHAWLEDREFPSKQ
jgi:hypothetical protein